MTVLDARVNAVLRPLTRLWCYLTGKSNFALAKALLIISPITGVLVVTVAIEMNWPQFGEFLLGDLLPTASGSGTTAPSAGTAVLALAGLGLVVGLMSYYITVQWRKVSKIQGMRPQYKNAVPTEVLEFVGEREKALVLEILMTGLFPSQVGMWLVLGMAAQVATHYDEGGRTLLSDVKGWLSKFQLNVEPALAPIPVRKK